MTVAAPALSPVTTYALDVVRGAIVAGRLVRLACARHLRDLEHGHERGLHFDAGAADRAIAFFRAGLKLSEGEHAGRPFVLQPWQAFIVGSIFGWKGEDGYRRFRRAYVETAKGNGKSPLAAGIGLLCLVADHEPGAEVYAAAVTRDQAKISFGDAVAMVEASPTLSRKIEVLVNNLHVVGERSFFRPVSSEARALDGKRVHCAIIDEIHEHRDDQVVEKMRAGTKGRRQALIFEITNSGVDRKTICFAEHEYATKILEGALENDSWFAYVCQLDPCEAHRLEGRVSPVEGCPDCDDWTNEDVWLKANPNLGVSVTVKYLREQVAEALGMTGKQGIVQRLNFCMWTQSVTKWLNPDTWALGAVMPARSLAGLPCYCAIDLSSTEDLTVMLLWFPEDGGDIDAGGDALAFFFAPEERILERARRDAVPYDLWRREGWIEATPGDVVDYDVLVERFRDLNRVYDIREVAIDTWNASGVESRLAGEGAVVVRVPQSFLELSAPSKQLERMARKETLHHGGNPVLTWMASNVALVHDAYENIRPSKDKSVERIDGIVALVMAIGRAMVHVSQWHGIYIPTEP